MNVADNTLTYVNNQGENVISPCIGLTPDVLPEVRKPLLAKNLQTGVSTNNVLPRAFSADVKNKEKNASHWYALRATYGREKKAYDFMVNKGIVAFYPTIVSVKIVDGNRKPVVGSRIPNIFFAYGTEDKIKSFVYDNVNLPFLRFYYRHFCVGNNEGKEPLVVPDNQIDSLKIICAAVTDDIIIIPSSVSKFRTGQPVRVTDGKFKGVTGKVARYHGQQRVGVIINGLFTVATAYVPSAFLEINNLNK